MGFSHIRHHLEKKHKGHKPSSPSCSSSLETCSLFYQELTQALSSSIQLEAHVALTTISNARHGDAPAIQAEVTEGLTHVGDVLREDNPGS